MNRLFHRFDPGRHLDEEGGKKQTPFVGWGAGRHPCLGMRFAKLEIKWIAALFVTAFDYNVVNSANEILEKLPQPNRNTV